MRHRFGLVLPFCSSSIPVNVVLLLLLLLFVVVYAGAAAVPAAKVVKEEEHVHHYDGFKLLRAIPLSQNQLTALHNLSETLEHDNIADDATVQVWKVQRQLGAPSDFLVGPARLAGMHAFLAQHRIAHHTLVNDFGVIMRGMDETYRLDEPEELLSEPDEFDLGRYHCYESIVQYLQLLAHTYPDFVTYESIGKTTEGRELALLKLGYPVVDPTVTNNNDSSGGASNEGKPIFLLDAGIHAREWIAPATALHVINAFINDIEWHALLKLIDVHIIPVLNPDGYTHTWTKDRLWRLTRSGPRNVNEGECTPADNPKLSAITGDGQFVCYGVDPNRNFPFHWAESGASMCPCSEIFAGPHPLSEPECAHLAAHMQANRARIGAYLTLHAYGNLLIHAWNYAQRTYPEDVQELKAMAHQMAERIRRAGGPAFRVGSAPDILYEAAGGSDDFARSIGIKYAYTMELSAGDDGGLFFGGFVFPERKINEFTKKVLPGIHALAEKVHEI